MGAEEKISISLDEELAEVIRQAIRCGDYTSADEVVAQAMEFWREQRKRDIARLRELVEEGLKGPFEPWEGVEAILAKAKARQA
jgi:putative addiction module CopG family antidote